MALKLSKETDIGASADYFKVATMHVSGDGIKAIVALFISQEKRQEGKAPVSCKEYSISAQPSALESQSPFALVYQYLKSLPEFSGAEDV